jgi:ABC-2 type transport system permease protein
VSWQRIRAIYRKDIREAFRDSRVLTALLFPLLIGVLYSLIFPDETAKQSVKVGVASEGVTVVTRAISQTAGNTVRLTFVRVSDVTALERAVRQDKVDVGLVVPAGFDGNVKAGRSPVLTAVMPASPKFGGDFVAAALDRAVQSMAGRAPAARIEQRSLPPERDGTTALDVLGQRTTFILVAIIMLLTMIAVYAVPAVLVDETEKKTMEALTLIASTAEVIASKALFGITLCLVSVPVLLLITRGQPSATVPLALAVALSAVLLVGVGLVTCGLFRTQQQVNTWSGVILLVLLAPALTIGLPTPDVVDKVLWLLPTGHTFRLIANAFAGDPLYEYGLVSLAVLVAWTFLAYGLLWRQLSRREA